MANNYDDIGIEASWFRPDGATCLTAQEAIHMLCSTKFHNVIFLILQPLDYLLWGHSKQRVYANMPNMIPDLK